MTTWPVSLIPRAQELYDTGLSAAQVSRALGPSTDWVWRHVKCRPRLESGTSRGYWQGRTGIDYDACEREALRLYLAGQTYSEISRRFGCSPQTVGNWIKKAELRRRPPSGARRRKAAA